MICAKYCEKLSKFIEVTTKILSVPFSVKHDVFSETHRPDPLMDFDAKWLKWRRVTQRCASQRKKALKEKRQHSALDAYCNLTSLLVVTFTEVVCYNYDAAERDLLDSAQGYNVGYTY